jgi:SOS response regulatory protein OraA/RecX
MDIIENKFIKQNNEQIQREHYFLYKKIRKTWVVAPVTKVKKSKKVYNRKFSQKELQHILKQEDF